MLYSPDRYHNESEFSLKIRCFSALAFIPPAQVANSFEEFSEDDAKSNEFLSYFEHTYIGVVRGRGATRRRAIPLFPIDMWNFYSLVQNNTPRTNNAQEGFHSAFNRTLPVAVTLYGT